MATRRQCPNCGNNDNNGYSLSRCKSCGFVGCYKSGFLSASGCWKKTECPRCGARSASEHFAYIAEHDSN